MNSSIVFLLIATILGIQAYNYDTDYWNENEAISEESLKGLIDDAKALFEKLQKAIKGAVDKAYKDLAKLLKQVENFANDIINKTEEAIKKEFEKFDQQYEHFKQLANETGKNISECTAEYETDIKELYNNLTRNLTNCVTKRIDYGNAIINETKSKINNTYYEIDKYYHELGNCGTSFSSIFCYTKLIGRMGWALMKLPVKISKNVGQATILISTLFPVISACGTVHLGHATIEGGKIVVNIAECVNNKTKEIDSFY